ncbi:GFA family protein [Oricola sp.]|uniref:GFA family protein n=1 Tax=Oricola sp. TaxID=1979950 RepID=UPI0025D69BFD|nr:GFA family protein [Oricola sp.]MCI5077291.1 GFA family protein [Oricola sp.]
MDQRSGGCHCGAVSFTVTGPVRGVIYCHCEQCRKQSGHVVAATACGDEQFAPSGMDNLTWYAASNTAKRGFCRTCGSLLFWKANDSDRISIMAGSFDQPSGLTATEHIHVADKGDYYEISDGLPQHAVR